MATAEAPHTPTAPAGVSAGSGRERAWAWGGLAVVLLGGLGLRLWGVGQGLPYVYNSDEADHFVPRAVRMFEQGTLNPHYFANPPALTYVLHYAFALAYGGAHGAVHELAAHPASIYTLARVLVALLGTGALWLLYIAGARLFGRAVGLLAAALEAVAFLPVFYAHLALNDAPTLAPVALSLLGSAGVLRKGRARDHLLAGVGLGLACASKYTAGIVVAPLIAAIAARYLDTSGKADASGKAGAGGKADANAGRHALAGIALAGASALAAFLIANPYALLDYSAFHAELVHQSTLSAETQGKLGAPKQGGLVYYLWSLTWGLGWAPALAALGGAVAMWRSQRAPWWMLVPAALLFLVFMGTQGRYFGRWLLPIFPILCLLAAYFVVWLVRWAGRMLAAPPQRLALAVLLATALLVQGFAASVHSGLVLSRTDTRTLTREWMLAHIPAGAPIVVEPVSPNVWGERWNKYPSLISRIAANGALTGQERLVGIEDYERTLSPSLVGYYERHGYCWVVRASTESGRAFADRSKIGQPAVPLATAYYRVLGRHAEVVYRASPYASGQQPVPFGFDWSFDYYPSAYERPGPAMTVYRLRGGRCRTAPG